jgi:transcriptional regulator with XRE-family HTH domain
LLIRQARERAGRTVAQLAEALQVKPGLVKAYEAGTREPSFGELTAMSDWLSVPPMSLLDEASQPAAQQPMKLQATMQLRNHVLGARLKQARMDKGQTLKATASAVGISANKLKSHELGAPMPVTVLEMLTVHLGLTMQHWLDADADLITKAQQQQAAFAALPSDVRDFVTDATALPYVQTAMRLRALPSDEVKRLAQALLGIKP